MSILSGIFTRSGKRVLHDGGAVPTILPRENVRGIGPLGISASIIRGLPPETFYFYVYASPAAVEEHAAWENAKGGRYLFFKGQTLGASYNAIDEIFKRAPKGIIGVYEVVIESKGKGKGILFVNMMSVRPGWKRNGLNMAMMRWLLQRYPERKLQFSDPTNEGTAFIKAAKEAGLPVAA